MAWDLEATMRLKGRLDKEGRIILPPEVAREYGLIPNAGFFLETGSDGLRIVRPATHLAKAYIEPTNTCNLQCRTCIRNSWHESMGFMESQVFDRIVNDLKDLSPPPSVFFGGFGEPLSHPRIVEMVAEVKALGCNVELITNGTLLSEKMSRGLIDAGLDGIWISLDGARPESFADVRLGAVLPQILANAAAFRDACTPFGYCYPEHISVGVVFVAMKRNIADLGQVVSLGERFGATRFLVTNVLPYHPDMCDDVLYSCSLNETGPLSPLFRVTLPLSDRNETTVEAIRGISSAYEFTWPARNHAESGNYCPFVRRGATVINWKGNASPCIPLMYDAKSYVGWRERFSRSYRIGNVSETPLKDIWRDPQYLAFRERVQMFDFPPCAHCGCQLSEDNEEDCYGNTFPTGGGCLWAQGIVQCP
jgi:MoaA/NifB/PqqE/SkfB family radical SAM enzyme